MKNKSLLFKNRLYNYLFLLFSSFFCIYLIFQLLSSDRGIREYLILSKEYEEKSNEYFDITNINTKLYNKIEGLNTNSLDLDLLDEMAKDKIGLLNNNEIVISLTEN
tara:strand:- start:807 stop:1127 length:321 start_codon:yes stop_codon:yes gene_type:complete